MHLPDAGGVDAGVSEKPTARAPPGRITTAEHPRTVDHNDALRSATAPESGRVRGAYYPTSCVINSPWRPFSTLFPICSSFALRSPAGAMRPIVYSMFQVDWKPARSMDSTRPPAGWAAMISPETNSIAKTKATVRLLGFLDTDVVKLL